WMDMLNRCFFALQDTITPMVAAIGMVLLNICFNLALVGPLSHGGLALGTSLSTAVAIGFLLWRLARRLGSLDLRALVKPVGLHLVSAVAGGLVGYISYIATGRLHLVFRLGMGLGVIVLVHVLTGALLGSDELAEARTGLLKKLGRT
ncbi:MAG TPA: lipid II flippase MurJ, partial [Symbiobacteriaceae bacterium]|nr:lipid II flippase MurJ [Symbiobacteriaceae bacterium]